MNNLPIKYITVFTFFVLIATQVFSADINQDSTTLKFSGIPFTNQILIECENIRGADHYEIRYAITPDFKQATSKISSVTRVEVEGLKPSTVYYLQARVLNKKKWSDWSPAKTFKTANFSTTIETYNMLSSGFDPIFPEHPWKDRKVAMASLILRPNNSPDILGVQEGNILSQVQSLDSLIKGTYDVHISKRPISARAIFWKRGKYELVSFDDDIEVLDTTVSQSTTARHISFVRLREKMTKQEILVLNLHTPSSKLKERNLMAKIVPQKAKELAAKYNNIPVVVMGDFNAFPKSADPSAATASMIVSAAGFVDTYTVATSKTNAFYSTHDRITSGIATSLNESNPNGSKRIDYIFTYPAEIATVSDYRIVIDFDGDSGTVLKTPVPSDHRPVRAVVHFFYPR